MKKIKYMAVLTMLLVMAVFSSCGAKAMTVSEAVDAINNLKHGGSITIVLNSDVSRITDKLKEALAADMDYLGELAESEGIADNNDEETKFFQKYAKKVKLDLSKTKITSIGDDAFEYCYSLASVIIPNSVTSIGKSAFRSCPLVSVTIPNSVTEIGDEAFKYCEFLTRFNIPASVTEIGNDAFYGCTNLSISVANDNKHFSAKDGVLYNKAGTVLISWPTAKNNVIIPDGVTKIGNRAFALCESITSVTIPNSVTSIGNGAFDDCKSLASATIPNSVTEIGDSAFANCLSLTSVNIPNSVTEIGDGAFWGCESLTNVNIADSVTSIGFRAFQHCRLLANVTIPDSVTSIGKSAFKGCGLTSIEIPKSVEKIGDDAFKDCASLKSVSLLNFSDGTSRTAFDDNVRVTFANGTQYTWGEFWTYIEYLEYLSLFY